MPLPDNFPAAALPITIQSAQGTLYLPKNPPAKTPWVWYAPAQGLGPANVWIATRLLQNNIAFTTLNVGESGGSPTGTALLQAFYEHLTTRHNLSHKPVLWPQSRGGLQLYNWAIRHPRSVAAIAGTYTVVNLEEWTTSQHPMVQKVYRHALEAYNLTPEEFRAQLPQNNPIENLALSRNKKSPSSTSTATRMNPYPWNPTPAN